MKQSLKYLVGSMLVASVAALTACGGGGGGGGGDSAPPPASTGIGSLTVSTIPVYIGQGLWSGDLNITSPYSQQYMDFTRVNGIQYDGTFILSLRFWTTTYNGKLPGKMGLEIGGRRFPAGGNGNGTPNGIVMKYSPMPSGGPFGMGYQPGGIYPGQYPGQQANGCVPGYACPQQNANQILQVAIQFTDLVYKSRATVVLYWGSTQIATGTADLDPAYMSQRQQQQQLPYDPTYDPTYNPNQADPNWYYKSRSSSSR